jgi:hypothetical protein
VVPSSRSAANSSTVISGVGRDMRILSRARVSVD